MKLAILNTILIALAITSHSYSQQFNSSSYKKPLNSVSLGIREKMFEPIKTKTDTVFIEEKKIPKKDFLVDDEIEINDSEYKSESNGFTLPLKNIIIKSGFGLRKHPITGVWKNHNGVDFKAHYEKVNTVLNGIVVGSGWSKESGNYLAIKTNNYVLYYLHLNEYYYKNNEIVNSGDVIGLSGTTGLSTAPHLHFAVKRNNNWINPMEFLTELNEINLTLANNP